MFKERIRSCLLVFLVVSSVVLSFNIWINGKLWPNGYNFFSNITNHFKFETKSYFLSKENISYPEKIIVNNLEHRNLYTHTSEQYNNIVNDVLSVIKQSISGYKYTETEDTEWNNALSTGSVYVSYPIAYDTTLLCGILDITPNDPKVKSVQEFIIVPSVDKSNNAMTIYTKDFETKKVYKAIITSNTDVITNIINQYAIDSLNLMPYSFELNFDSSDDESVEQKVVIDPTITLKLENTTLPVVTTSNYLYDIYNNTEISDKLLSAFGYNTTNSRSYVDKHNTAVYVENYSTLKIHSNGLLEYKSIDPTKGISIAGDTSATLYDCFIACIEFVNSLWDSTLPYEPFNINLTSNVITQSSNNSFKITMDYYVNGYQIISADTKSHNNYNHGIEITVTDGKITEYKQLFNKFITTEQTMDTGSSIDAIDTVFTDENMTGSTVSELNIVYTNTDNTLSPVWAAKINDNNIIIKR